MSHARSRQAKIDYLVKKKYPRISLENMPDELLNKLYMKVENAKNN